MKQTIRNQFIALPLTAVTCVAMVGLLWLQINLLNRFTSQDIIVHFRWADILIGLTVYLKTSIDFAIFIGQLMSHNRGLKSRIAIEIGTALGNAVGTLAVLLVWVFFKEVDWLLAVMILAAALVLLRMAEDGLEHVAQAKPHYPTWLNRAIDGFTRLLELLNKPFSPLLSRLLPGRSLNNDRRTTFIGLMLVAFTVPFILGLDDFAGYVPLFNVVNVLGFATGAFIGHMLLNAFLYLSPKRTIAAVKNPVISLFGSIAFVVLAIWGLSEAARLAF